MYRSLVVTTVTFLMSAAGFAGNLTYTNLDYTSVALCGGVCPFGTTFGWASVNDNNEVATSFAPSSTVYYGYTYQGGVFSAPIQNSALPTSLAGIDNAGIVSGFYNGAPFRGMDYNGSTFSNVIFPSNTTFTDGTPNPFTSGTISNTFLNGSELGGGTSPTTVGFFTTVGQTNQTKGFVYTPGNTPAFSPLLCTSTAFTTNAYSINDSGLVVGYCKTSSGANQAGFIYDDTTPNTAPILFSTPSLATAIGDTVTAVFLTSIDDSGHLMGWYNGGANNQSNGFLCLSSSFNATDSLQHFANCSVFDFPQASAFNPLGTVNGTQIFAMNNVGSVVGAYTETDGSTHIFLASPAAATSTPEPATLCLVGLVFVGLSKLRQRR